MSNKIAILQPNYIPWKGVFDLINRVDTFVFYDDVQYTTKDWRNRNKIKTDKGNKWLTVPVISKSKRHQLICDAMIDETKCWQKEHYTKISYSYQKTKYFDKYKHILDAIYLDNKWSKISELDIFATKLIASEIGISANWVNASDLKINGSKKGEKVIKICKILGCMQFINGPSSRSFMDENLFKQEGIQLNYMSYSYPKYKQLFEPFSHQVTVLDVLFNCGPNSKNFICMKETGK
jgi:hypothetical protein